MKALYILTDEAMDLIYGPAEQKEIGRLVEVVAPPQTASSILNQPELLREVELIFSGWGAPPMDENFLQQTPNLKAVFYGSGSVRSFVTDAFWERDIVLCNAYAANAVPVSEFTLASILLSLKLAWRFAAANKGAARMPSRSEVPGVFGSTVGLISLGMIGRLVRERLRPFDIEVIAFDPLLDETAATKLGVELVSLDELFCRSDVVSLHAPLLEETVGMVRKEHFASMKLNATFINTARGAIIDEAGLVEILSERPDLHAVLDVTSPEPPDEGSILYSLSNVTLTPHIAGSVNRECRRMGRHMIDELNRYLKREPLRWRLSKEGAAVLA
ncbi:MAG: hydroxyacid dehydrogenase [Opitutales bacterium]